MPVNGGTGHTKIQIGTAAVNAGDNTITFSEAFSNTNYRIAISMIGSGAAAVTTYISSKATGSFVYTTNSGPYNIEYIAIGD